MWTTAVLELPIGVQVGGTLPDQGWPKVNERTQP